MAAVTQRRRSRGGWETEQAALLGPGLGLGPAPPPLSPFNSEAPPWRCHAQISRSLPWHASGAVEACGWECEWGTQLR